MDRFSNINGKALLWIVGSLLVIWFLAVNVPSLIPDIFNAISSCTTGVTSINIPLEQ